MNKKVALYFGSFNPIHIGHQKLAQTLLTNDLVDELWFVISPCNPLKNSSDLLDEHLRLNMVELSIKDNKRFKTCTIEFDMPIPSYTIDTLKLLTSKYSDINFSLVIGTDNALLFNRWKNYTEILNNYSIWVYPRFGYDFNEVKDKYPQMKLLITPYYDISSTQVRNGILNGEDISSLLNLDVYNFIKYNNLYKN